MCPCSTAFCQICSLEWLFQRCVGIAFTLTYLPDTCVRINPYFKVRVILGGTFLPLLHVLCSANVSFLVATSHCSFQVDYDNIRNSIIEQCKASNLQPLESFITKIIQVGVSESREHSEVGASESR